LIRRVQFAHFERLFGRTPSDADLDLIALVRSRVPPERLDDFRVLLQQLIASFEAQHPGSTRSAKFRHMLAMLHERVGYNLLTVSRRGACRELCRALRVWPPAIFAMPWWRIVALGVAGDGVRRLYEKFAR
jgi:hypothetical protein